MFLELMCQVMTRKPQGIAKEVVSNTEHLPSARPVSWLLHPLVLLIVVAGGLDVGRAGDFSAVDAVSSCFTVRVVTEACATF